MSCRNCTTCAETHSLPDLLQACFQSASSVMIFLWFTDFYLNCSRIGGRPLIFMQHHPLSSYGLSWCPIWLVLWCIACVLIGCQKYSYLLSRRLHRSVEMAFEIAKAGWLFRQSESWIVMHLIWAQAHFNLCSVLWLQNFLDFLVFSLWNCHSFNNEKERKLVTSEKNIPGIVLECILVTFFSFLGTVLKRWKRNWVVLYQDGSIKYFQSPDDHSAEEAERMGPSVAIMTGDRVGLVSVVSDPHSASPCMKISSCCAFLIG